MGKVRDEAALACYRRVLLTLGNVTGYVQWKALPVEWLHKNLPGATAKLVQQMMADYVAAGGAIDQVQEKRPEYVSWRFHYDLRLPMSNRRVYIESVLMHEPDDEDCTIWIVNMHDA